MADQNASAEVRANHERGSPVSKNAKIRNLFAALLQPGGTLIAAALLLPAGLLGLATWYSYVETFREAEARVERTARILEEHAVKVFETHRLVIQQVAGRFKSTDWSREPDRADLQELLKRFPEELDQVATVTVTDAAGHMRASSRTYPADPKIDFEDRDWFQKLKASGSTPPFVSRSYIGRQSGQRVFNLAGRLPDGPGGAFTGAVAVSVDRSYFERFYHSVDPTFDHSVLLVREDGQILARQPPTPLTSFPPGARLLKKFREAPSGVYEGKSQIDGVERFFAYRKIGNYPVYVTFGIAKDAALAAWRSSLRSFGIVAGLASLALVVASLLAVRQTDREKIARRRWQETAAALQAEAAERGRVEEQLRQAQKMEAVGRLTGGVAHDFNNLLTAVIGSLDLLRRRPAGLDARNADLISTALEGANRAAALTGRLLAFSRQQPLQPVRVEANKLVAGMSDLLRSTLGETIMVETVLAGGLWPTLVDPNQLESAILNLAVNARDAMPDGGKLTIETANAHLDETYAAQRGDLKAGQFVLIAVSDTGTGMPPDVLSKVFEPFFSTKGIGKGTGLGLSQVYGFAKQSDGHVAAYSEVGHGSTFKLYLPRLRQAELKPAKTVSGREAETPAGQSEKVLVVEDEAIVRRLSVAALEEAGYEIVEAGDGPEALELVRRNPDIALLFTDVVLAGPMNGRALADAVLRERPDLPVLFTTGYTRNAIIHHGRLDEGVNFIGKPFTGSSLAAKVHALLDSRLGGPAVETLKSQS